MADESVEIEVALDDSDASAKVNRLGKSFGSAQQHVEKFNRKISSAGKSLLTTAVAATGLGVGFGVMARSIFQAADRMETLHQTITATLVSFSKWDSAISSSEKFNASVDRGAGIVAKFEKYALRMGADGTRNLEEAFRGMGDVVLGTLNMSEDKLVSFSQKVATLASVYSKSAQEASNVFSQAFLTGTVGGPDVISKFIRQALKATPEEIKKMAPEEIFQRLQKPLEEIEKVAEGMATGLGPQLNRMQMFFGTFTRDLMLPVVTEIAAMMGGWMKHLRQATDSGQTVAEVWGGKILGAFNKLRKWSAVLLEHWKALAVVVAGLKLTTTLPAIATSLANVTSVIGGAAQAQSAATGLIGKLGKFGGALSLATAGATALYMAAKAFTNWLDKRQTRQINQAGLARGSVLSAFKSLDSARETTNEVRRAEATRAAYAQLKSIGAISKGGEVNVGSLANALKAVSGQERVQFASLTGKFNARELVREPEAMEIARRFAGVFNEYVQTYKKDVIHVNKPAEKARERAEVKRGVVPKQQVNFTGDIKITQKFDQADPGNVYVRFKRDLAADAERRVQSRLTEPFGV